MMVLLLRTCACTNMFRRSLMNWSIGALPGENFDTWVEPIRQKKALASASAVNLACFASLPESQSTVYSTLFALRRWGAQQEETTGPSQ